MAGARRPDVTAIPLGRPSPGASSNQPERQGQRTRPRGERAARRSYSVLLPAGLAVPLALPPARCALTAPFHPCLNAEPRGLRSGGLLSVALSLGSPPPDVIRRRIRLEPGLSSAPSTGSGSGGRPADWRMRAYVAQAAPVKDIRRRSSGLVIEERAPGSFIEASLELWDCVRKRGRTARAFACSVLAAVEAQRNGV